MIKISKKGYANLIKNFNQIDLNMRECAIIMGEQGEGNIGDNAEFIYARERFAALGNQRRQLSERIHQLQVVDAPKQTITVAFLSTVHIRDEAERTERIYQVVGPDESDPTQGLLSYQSPLGQALMGKQSNDDVELEVNNQTKIYTILKISA